MKPIDFKIERHGSGAYEYVIGGIPLSQRIEKHEPQDLGRNPALGVVSRAKERLVLMEEPDLSGGITALYVCAMCGGYDGGSIGAKIFRDGDVVYWDKLGVHYDYDEEAPILFKKVSRFAFDWDQYSNAIHSVPVD